MSPRTWTGRVFIGVSLDGYIARLDGDIGWLTDPPAGREHADVSATVAAQTWESFFPSIDHVVMGRGTYETILTFDSWPFDGKSVVVLSRSLDAFADPRVSVARSVPDAAALLTAAGAQQVYVDGGQVIQEFLRADLIDEITVSWAPVLLGSGRPLFGELPRDVHLTVVGSQIAENGMVQSTYRVDRNPQTGP